MSNLDPVDDSWAQFLDPWASDPELDFEEQKLLEQARQTLKRPELWDGPSAGAREKLLDQARQVAPDVAPTPAKRWTSRPLMASAGLLAAVAAIVAVLFIPSNETPTPTGTNYEIAGGPYSPGASADLVVDPLANGVKLTLALDNVPAAEAGSYYSAWLVGPDGTVPVGSFHARGKGEGRTVSLWSGLDTNDYPMFMVTLQDEGEPLVPSDRVVLSGSVGG